MYPNYIFEEGNSYLGAFRNQLKFSDRLLLFLDYDGTLTPIRATPEQAVLSEKMRELLRILSEEAAVSVVIVTGRSFDDVFRKINLKRITYISNHGFEITSSGEQWLHPSVKRIPGIINKISTLLEERLSGISGILIENKGLTLSVHYRNSKGADIPIIESTIRKVVEEYRNNIKLTSGKKVFELRPNILWDKGTAVMEWLKSGNILNSKNPLIIAIGDDKTDEDMFEELRENAFTIKVGNDLKTNAKYFLNDYEEVYRFLSELYIIANNEMLKPFQKQ